MMTNRAHTRALAMIPTGPARVPLPGGQGGSFSAPRSCSWEDLGSSLGARPPLRVPGLVPGTSWGPSQGPGVPGSPPVLLGERSGEAMGGPRAQDPQRRPWSCLGKAPGVPWYHPGPRAMASIPGLVWGILRGLGQRAWPSGLSLVLFRASVSNRPERQGSHFCPWSCWGKRKTQAWVPTLCYFQ
jgi:hypothetical protein